MTFDWRARHYAAMADPRGTTEKGIVEFMRGVTDLIEGIGGYGYPDTVATPAFGEILSGFRTLLNYDLKRLDAGKLDDWAARAAEVVCWDLDEERILWPADTPPGKHREKGLR